MSVDPTVIISLFIGLAVLLLAAAYRAAKKHYDRMRAHGVRVPGVVVRNELQWGRTTTVRPVVRFVTQDGQTIEALDEHGTALAVPSYLAGASVTVLYDRENPSRFEVLGASRRAG